MDGIGIGQHRTGLHSIGSDRERKERKEEEERRIETMRNNGFYGELIFKLVDTEEVSIILEKDLPFL